MALKAWDEPADLKPTMAGDAIDPVSSRLTGTHNRLSTSQRQRGVPMTKPNTVALIVDPESGERIRDIAAVASHTWVVTSAVNDAVATRIRHALPAPTGQAAEGSVTTFLHDGDDRESWCAGILDAMDEHHNERSHHGGYAILEVYGTPLSERLRQDLSALGFARFASTAEGFRAIKRETR
ncbi:hypothetical protein [Burkholderia stabilis]|nr:hypothetical protein [Burkholderia stabilis]